jgi:transposase
MAYSSDLKNREYELLQPLINYRQLTRPYKWELRQVLNGIFYQLKNGCLWADIPKDLPPYTTCFRYFRKWSQDGTWIEVLKALHRLERERVGKKTRPYLTDSRLTSSQKH